MNIICPVCLTDMDGREVPDQLNMELNHSAAIAPCGHIFCIPCMVNLHLVVRRDDPFFCPLCLYSWKHTVCGHPSFGYPLGLIQQVESVPTRLRQTADNCGFCVLARSAEALTGFARIFYSNDVRQVPTQVIGISVSYMSIRWDAPDTSTRMEAPKTLRHLDLGETMGGMVRACLEQLGNLFRDNRIPLDIEQVRFEARLYDMRDCFPDEDEDGHFTIAGFLWRDVNEE